MMERHLVSAHLQLQYFKGGAESLPHQIWPDPKSVLLLHPLEKLLPFRQSHPRYHPLSRQPSPFLIPPSQLLSAEMILKTLHSRMLLQQLTALHPHHVFHPHLAVKNLHHQHRHNKSLTELPDLKKEPLQLHAHSHLM